MKILFIEDDAIETMKLTRTLSKLDEKHTLIQANNGEEALKILKENNLPDIILLDLEYATNEWHRIPSDP